MAEATLHGPTVRVAVVDDSPEFRIAADAVIAATPGFAAALTLPSGEEAVRVLTRADADLVLIDVRMPGIGGVAAARALGRLPDPPTVVLMSADPCPVIEADPAAHGAKAFVRKHTLCPRALRHLWSTCATPG